MSDARTPATQPDEHPAPTAVEMIAVVDDPEYDPDLTPAEDPTQGDPDPTPRPRDNGDAIIDDIIERARKDGATLVTVDGRHWIAEYPRVAQPKHAAEAEARRGVAHSPTPVELAEYWTRMAVDRGDTVRFTDAEGRELALDARYTAQPTTKRPVSDGAERLLGVKVPVLGEGYVALVDYMGNDESVVRAARMSYGEGTRSMSDDAALTEYLILHRHCYDAATEALTLRGFVPWPEVRADDCLAVWSEADQTLRYETPSEVVAFPYQGDLYHVEHQGLSLAVTPDHKMWVSQARHIPGASADVWAGWGLVPASELGHRSMVRYRKAAPYREGLAVLSAGLGSIRDAEAFGKLVGFFVGDGYANAKSPNSITFHLRKPRKIAYLQALADALGWELRCGAAYSFVYPGLGAWFAEECYGDGGYKCLPSGALQSPLVVQCAILDGLRNSDGSTKRSSWVYMTNSEVLAGQVQILGVHCNQPMSLNAPRAGGLYALMALSRGHSPVVNQSRRNTSYQPYDGTVYCATTSTGVLVVRRDNKVALSGNTSPLEAPTLEFLIQAPIFVARQFYTHRASSRTEVSYRYSEVPEGFYLPDVADMHTQDTKNRQGRGVALDPDAAAAARNVIERANRHSQEAYHFLAVGTERGGWGVAREIARQVQPVAAWTVFRWKQDLHNLLHFLSLRLKPNAQLETRRYAEAMADVVTEAFPVVWAAWYEHVFAATTLSGQATDAVAQVAYLMAKGMGPAGARLVATAREGLPKRQRAQFDALIARGELVDAGG